MSLNSYFDTKEASERYGLSESWLAKLRVKGGGPSHIKCGRRVLYEAKSFEDWLEGYRRSNTSEEALQGLSTASRARIPQDYRPK
jgi:Helix-turn-helix domain